MAESPDIATGGLLVALIDARGLLILYVEIRKRELLDKQKDYKKRMH